MQAIGENSVASFTYCDKGPCDWCGSTKGTSSCNNSSHLCRRCLVLAVRVEEEVTPAVERIVKDVIRQSAGAVD